jgi:hypothetical protein
VQLSATIKTRTVPTTHPLPSHPPSRAAVVGSARLLAADLAAEFAALPAAERLAALGELAAALHEPLAGPLISAAGEAAEEGLSGARLRVAAGPGYPFLRAALGLVGA